MWEYVNRDRKGTGRIIRHSDLNLKVQDSGDWGRRIATSLKVAYTTYFRAPGQPWLCSETLFQIIKKEETWILNKTWEPKIQKLLSHFTFLIFLIYNIMCNIIFNIIYLIYYIIYKKSIYIIYIFLLTFLIWNKNTSYIKVNIKCVGTNDSYAFLLL